MKSHIFTGCATALITPFKNSGKDVDLQAFEKLILFLLQNDNDALVVNGTTAETPTLTAEEKHLLIKEAIGITQKRVPVIAGAGSNNTETAVKQCNAAEKEGVNGLLVVTPFYNKCTQQGLIDHYNYIADRVSTPIIVYNVPSRTGVNIWPETYKALGEHKNICGVKEASGDMSLFAKSIAMCKDELDFYSGNDDITVPTMSLGGKGVISVAANIIPLQMHKITELCIKNDLLSAGKLQNKYSKLLDLMFCEVNPQPVKYAASILHNFENSLRMPLCKISEKNGEKIKRELTLLGLI